MKLQGFAVALAVLFCHTVVTTNGFYIRANNQTTTPISVDASHNATLATTLTSPVVNSTKLPTTNSTLLVVTTTQKPAINAAKATAIHTSGSMTATKEQVTTTNSTLLVVTTTQKPAINAAKATAIHTSGSMTATKEQVTTTSSTLLVATTTQKPTINATKATAINTSRSMNTAIKEQVTFGSTRAATTTTASTTVAITSSSDKKVTELPWVRRHEDSSGHSEGHDKSFLSTVYGKVALVSGVAFLSVVLAAVVFLSVTCYHERKSEQRVLMGDIESIDDQDDDTYNTTR